MLSLVSVSIRPIVLALWDLWLITQLVSNGTLSFSSSKGSLCSRISRLPLIFGLYSSEEFFMFGLGLVLAAPYL